MAAKFIVAFCAQALIAQCVLSQCISHGPIVGPGFTGPYGAYDGLAGPSCGGAAATGGGFFVTSVSPMAPTGLTVVSENAIEGPLIVGGNLPFLASVALEGIVPTAGSGAVSYGCGDGAVGIVNEGVSAGIVGPSSFGPGMPAGLGYGSAMGPAGVYGQGLISGPAYAGYGGVGCGCGGIY